MKETLITPTGLAQLTRELERLKTTGRAEITERIRAAISTDADVAANADYLNVREDQALLEARIARLEQRLDAARVAEPDATNGIVDLGERVHVRDLETGERFEYELVGTHEADPGSGRISAESPVGRALLGCRAGEVTVVHAPKGRLRLEVLAVDALGASARA